jgi:hypothetical protein
MMYIFYFFRFLLCIGMLLYCSSEWCVGGVGEKGIASMAFIFSELSLCLTGVFGGGCFPAFVLWIVGEGGFLEEG